MDHINHYILNKNLVVYDHQYYFLLYNLVTEETFKVGIDEYSIIRLYINKEYKYNKELFEHENVKNLIEDCKNKHIIVDRNYFDIEKKSFIKRVILVTIRNNSTHNYLIYIGSVITGLERLSVIALLFVALSTFYYKEHYFAFLSQFQEKRLPLFIMVILGISITIISLIVHEVSHMLVSISKGIDVPEIGIKILGPIVWMYTRFIDLDVHNYKDKVEIYYAGCCINLYIFVVSWLLLPFLSSSGLLYTILFIFANVNISLYLFNMLTIIKLDGQKILISELDLKEGNHLKTLFDRYLKFKGIAIVVCLIILQVNKFLQ